MTLRTRRILYCLFILAFLIITPIIWLYAAGYRLDNGLVFHKTGILVLDTDPEGAKVYIDGKPHRSFLEKILSSESSVTRTPIKLKNLIPGEYTVRLEKEGYHAWSKRVAVKPGGSTFAEDITLFKSSLPLLELPGNFENIKQSYDKRYIAGISGNELILYDIQKEKENAFKASTSTRGRLSNAEIKWSSDSERVLFGDAMLFSINKWNDPIGLRQQIGAGASKVNFDRHDNSKVFYTDEQKLYSLDVDSNTNSVIPLARHKVSSYLVKGNDIYFLSPDDYSMILYAADSGSGDIERKISLPYSDYSFMHKDGELLSLYDVSHNLVYIIDPFSRIGLVKETLNNAQEIEWTSRSKKLYYTNRYEIWEVGLFDSGKSLLTRISNPIDAIISHPDGKHILYATDATIDILELEYQNRRKAIRLTEMPYVKDVFLDKDGNNAYFLSEVGSRKGIYKLNIR